MPRIDIVKNTPIYRSGRVMQVEGLFDLAPAAQSSEQWSATINLPEQWSIGVIVGPSGSGKTTIARELFGSAFAQSWQWSHDRSVIDDFPSTMSIKEIITLLSSVGFSSPPSWLRPYHVLSNGEQFRVHLARTLAEMPDLAVIDEFTSVVDRTVAQIGSAAVARAVRASRRRFVAVSCHYDILDWLEPDWIYEPNTDTLSVGRLRQRPSIPLAITRVHSSAWQLFRKHHYLDHDIHAGSVCFCAFWHGIPVAFGAILHFPHPKSKNMKREHRMVCLPDYQGIGIGTRMSTYLGALCRGLGYRYLSQTSHPIMIHSRAQSADWKMIAKPNNTSKVMAGSAGLSQGKSKGFALRLRATFEYTGKALPHDEALRVWHAIEQ